MTRVFTEQHRLKLSAALKNRKLSDQHKSNIGSSRVGLKRPPRSEEWKRNLGLSRRVEKPSYQALHTWLRTQKRPSACEHCGIEGRLSAKNRWTLQWALMKGKEYERTLDNFISLCVKCHHTYDDNSSRGWATRKRLSTNNLN